jgi:hypothetical protein
MLWDGMIEKGHTPRIKPIFLASRSGFLGKCTYCDMGGAVGQEIYGKDFIFGSALDNECPVNKEK